MLDIFNKKYNFKPGCFSCDVGKLKIKGTGIYISFTMNKDKEIIVTNIDSDSCNRYSKGYFHVTLKYSDYMDRPIEIPVVSLSITNQYGYFASDYNMEKTGILIDYYDREAVDYMNNHNGSFEGNFIEPDARFTFLYENENSAEEAIAYLVNGSYDLVLIEETSKKENKVYCKK